MNPLDKLVGLKPLDTAPTSGYFVNDLPGVGSELLEKLADKDALDLAAVWAKVKRNAWRKLLDQVELALADRYGWRKTVYQTQDLALGGLPFGFAESPVAAAGLLVELPNTQGLDVFVDKLRFFLGPGASGQAAVVFQDLATGLDLDVVDTLGQALALNPVDLAPGLNVVEVGGLIRPVAQASFFVGLAALDGQDLATLTWRSVALDQADLVSQAAAFILDGATAADAFVDSWALAPLLADLRVECSLARAIDRNPGDWTSPWLNLLGAEILAEKIYSPKTNYWASGNLARADENRQALVAQFTASLNRLIKRLDVGALCATCSDSQQGYNYQVDLTA